MSRADASTPSRLQLGWFAGALSATVALAIASAWPLYESSRTVLVGSVGAILGVAVAFLAARRGWSIWLSGVALLLVYIVVSVPLAVPSAMGDIGRMIRGAVDATTGIALAWKPLLTVSLPANDYQLVMVPLLVAVMAGAWSAATLITRGSTRSAFAVLPMSLMVVFGLAFGPVQGSGEFSLGGLSVPSARHVGLALGTVLVCVAWLIGRERIDRRAALEQARSRTKTVHQAATSGRASVRRGVLAAVMLTAALAVAAAALPATDRLPTRTGLRDEVVPEEALSELSSPLASYREWFTPDLFDADLLTLDDAQGVERIRLATLDSYDGVVFSVGNPSSGTLFTRQPGKQSRDMTITVNQGYSGVWVPLATASGGAPEFLGPRSEALADNYFASATSDAGLVALPSSEGVGLRGDDAVRVAKGSVPVASIDAIGTATGGDPLVAADDFPALADWVEQQGGGRTGADLIELTTRLRERGYLSHSSVDDDDATAWTSALPGYTFESSRPGHSRARIESLFSTLLEQERRAGPRASERDLISAVGDDEQFATAVALLARFLGFDSRVVIGFRLVPDTLQSGVEPCAQTCKGRNVTAWAEVKADGQWFALDATPQVAQEPIRIRQGENPPKNPTVPLNPEAAAIEPPQVASDTSKKVESPEQEDTEPSKVRLSWIGTAAGYAGAGLLTLLPLAVFPVAVALRRASRRRAENPELALVGAWAELMDVYVDSRIEVPQRLTRGEVADVVNRPAAASLAALVDRAVFAEHAPTQQASELAWQIVGEEAASLRSERRLGDKIRTALFPRSSLRAVARSEQTHFTPYQETRK